MYGYPRETAPFLSRLAESGVVFESAYSASSWTAPATASLFTSLYPEQHGVTSGLMATRDLQRNVNPSIELNRIPAAIETLGEVMKSAGFATYALVDNINIRESMGFAQGFDTFKSGREDRESRKGYVGASRMGEILESWRAQILSQSKYFLYLHYMDTHGPYHARRPWYRSGDRDGYDEDRERYDSEIGFVDQKIRELYELFGWDRNTLLIVLSDHGAEFGERGRTGHGKTLYNEVLRIPLLVHGLAGPGPARRIRPNVSIVDILPTLVQFAGLPSREDHEGVSLLDLARGEESPGAEERPLFAHLEKTVPLGEGNRESRRDRLKPDGSGHQHFVSRAVIQGGWKLIVDSRGWRKLFDIGIDPLEQTDLAESHPDKVVEFGSKLDIHSESARLFQSESFEKELTPREIERLKSLGYVQ
jgi:arylsulfatase A-like enzyme